MSASDELYYKVFTVEYHGRPNHVSIFVETEKDASGKVFHVVGNILTGMKYESKFARRPDDSESYVPESRMYLGQIHKTQMEKLADVCRAIKPPGAQLNLNGTKKDPSKPIRRCGDWVEEVKAKIKEEGLLQQ